MYEKVIEKKEVKLTLGDIKRHVLENRYEASMLEQSGSQWRCIDGREERGRDDQNSLPEFARPGAGLGFVAVALAAMHKIGKLEKPEIAKLVENVLGSQITFHSDNHQHSQNIECAGCGHIMGLIKNCHDYGLDESDTEFLVNSYIPQIAQKQKEKGQEPVVYQGNHKEAAVVIVDDPKVGLPNLTEKGPVYVYNRGADDFILDHLALEIKQRFIDFDLNKIKEALREVKDKQNKETLSKLAKNLPKFTVSVTQDENSNESLVVQGPN